MQNAAFVIIDIQNDITKNYKENIGNIAGVLCQRGLYRGRTERCAVSRP